MGKKKEKMIKVLRLNAGEAPEVEVIENKLEAFQGIVGGLIEVVGFKNVLCIINEEGKLLDLKPNFMFPLYHTEDKQYFDVICGDVVFVGDDGAEFRSLTEQELEQAFLTIMEGKIIMNKFIRTGQLEGV